MSSKKVEQRKYEKKNRKELMAKEKRNEKIRIIIACAIAACFAAWFVVSLVAKIRGPKPTIENTFTYSIIDSFPETVSGAESTISDIVEPVLEEIG